MNFKSLLKQIKEENLSSSAIVHRMAKIIEHGDFESVLYLIENMLAENGMDDLIEAMKRSGMVQEYTLEMTHGLIKNIIGKIAEIAFFGHFSEEAANFVLNIPLSWDDHANLLESLATMAYATALRDPVKRIRMYEALRDRLSLPRSAFKEEMDRKFMRLALKHLQKQAFLDTSDEDICFLAGFIGSVVRQSRYPNEAMRMVYNREYKAHIQWQLLKLLYTDGFFGDISFMEFCNVVSENARWILATIHNRRQTKAFARRFLKAKALTRRLLKPNHDLMESQWF